MPYVRSLGCGDCSEHVELPEIRHIRTKYTLVSVYCTSLYQKSQWTEVQGSSACIVQPAERISLSKSLLTELHCTGTNQFKWLR